MEPEYNRIDSCAQVVHVGKEKVLNPPVLESFECAAFFNGLGKVTVSRCIVAVFDILQFRAFGGETF